MDECPHCGSPDFENVGSGTPRICLDCGYDDENGATFVCPGGKHPLDSSGPCCPACRKRVPRDLPGLPKWRMRLRKANADVKRLPRFDAALAATEVRAIEIEVRAWVERHLA